MNLQQLTVKASADLQATSSSPRLDAELLLAHCLGRPRSYLLAWPEHTPDETQHERFMGFVASRAKGVPIAYLLGEKEFWGLSLQVGSGVLVPRPDTELLVEHALQLPLPANAQVADLGTGSGACALALATERPAWQIDAVDASAQALEYAESNRKSHALANVRLIHSDWFSALAGQRYHLIVSNPPYIEDDDPHLQGDSLSWEPKDALVSGADGLDDIRRIVAEAPTYLRSGGTLMIEHGFDQAPAVRSLFEANGFSQWRCYQDLAGQDRLSAACLLAAS